MGSKESGTEQHHLGQSQERKPAIANTVAKVHPTEESDTNNVNVEGITKHHKQRAYVYSARAAIENDIHHHNYHTHPQIAYPHNGMENIECMCYMTTYIKGISIIICNMLLHRLNMDSTSRSLFTNIMS